MKKIRMAILLLAMAALLTVSSVAETAYLGTIEISYGASGGWGSASAYTSASYSSHITAGITGAAFYIEVDGVGQINRPDSSEYGNTNNASDYASYGISGTGYAYSVDSTHSYYYTAEGYWTDTSYFYDSSMGY